MIRVSDVTYGLRDVFGDDVFCIALCVLQSIVWGHFRIAYSVLRSERGRRGVFDNVCALRIPYPYSAAMPYGGGTRIVYCVSVSRIRDVGSEFVLRIRIRIAYSG